MADTSSNHLPGRSLFSGRWAADALPRLLVSVRDASEARMARRAGVDWIDLKNPDSGSLGAPELATSQAVAQELADFPCRSIALGELADLDLAASHSSANVREMAEGFPIAKVGLARLGQSTAWQTAFRALARLLTPETALVPVIYADYQACDSPSPKAVLELIAEIQAPYLLIDTFHKAGQTVFDSLGRSELLEIVQQASASDCHTVLAGSLQTPDHATYQMLSISAVAVRGAVCHTDRRSALCEKKLNLWVSEFASA
ncbi:(5-formylfuran-3-yl)methyl phosphate synthase [Aureliella helgolandensis]|uniref:(5-formylfuran-3-yl)methyl phosphate synthase n=1 Tax=Aureliella helgolandensis TaxID=2527968 RepID=A0A518GC97_9BACT|nr:(5-formylfuran-3-yl)methyl phosphate synthase [Aureliella helgolandensis]QDV26221.1 hypothetical protein Q31a_45930 [Aureliella helgolandensis]